jgi:hypothetical protein
VNQADVLDGSLAAPYVPTSNCSGRNAFPYEVFRPSSSSRMISLTGHRSHVYSTFHPNEIQLDTIIQDSDWTNPDMMLTKDNFANLDKWQIDTALATWKAMSKSESCQLIRLGVWLTQLVLTPEMWLAW